MTDNLVKFNVSPKVVIDTYKQKTIKIKFDPNNEEWIWSVEHVQPVYLTGREKSLKLAASEAHKMVDTIADK